MADFLEKAKDVLRTEADAVLALIDRINGDFRAAVEMILACKGRVVITGMIRPAAIREMMVSRRRMLVALAPNSTAVAEITRATSTI